MSALPARRLHLATRRSPGGVADVQREVTHLPFSIGRAPDNDWALPDPGRVLSKRHCRITANGETWLVTDTSSNGTFVNGEGLDPDVPQVLRNGDRLVLGAYEVEALFGDSTQQSGGDPDFGAIAAMRSPTDDRQRKQPDDGPFTDDRLTSDPFPSSVDDVLDAARPSVGLPLDFDPLTSAEKLQESPYAASDHVPELETNFRAPRPGFELLPEDWDQDPEPRPTPRASPLARAERSDRNDSRESAETDFSAGSRPARLDAVRPWPVPDQEAGESDGGPPLAGPAPPRVAPPLAVRDQNQANSTDGRRPDPSNSSTGPQPSAPPTAHANETGAFAAFASGAGIPNASVAEPGKTLAALGAAFRTVVTGLRRMIIARAAIKGEFRIDQTMIRAAGNNPLKFSADDDDALAALLGIGRHRGMPPAQAIGEALRDIRRHELAVAAAMQQAVREVLGQLDPARIMRDTSASRLDHITGANERRAWQRYSAQHAEVMRALADDFDSVFGRSFGRAYEAALADIAAQDSERQDAGTDP